MKIRITEDCRKRLETVTGLPVEKTGWKLLSLRTDAQAGTLADIAGDSIPFVLTVGSSNITYEAVQA